MTEEKINLFDLGNVNNTCSDSSDSEVTKAKLIQKFKRKLQKKKWNQTVIPKAIFCVKEDV